MHIVVTGGAGFIGSHLVDTLIELGNDVLVLDSCRSRHGRPREYLPPAAQLVKMDIRDPGINRVIKRFQPEIIYHAAAQLSVAVSTRDPRYDADVNVLGTLNVLNAGINAGVRKVIFASSAATYGDVSQLPVDEDSPQNPMSPYGMTKLIAEQYLRFYKTQYGIDYTVLRCGNVYGPRQSPNGEAGVIAIFTARFLRREGIRIDSDGEQRRDYIYVSDVIRAYVAALARGSGEIYVIGSGQSTSVNEIYRALARATGSHAPITRAPPRLGETREIYFNAAKATRDLDWQPKVTLTDGLQATINFFRAKQLADRAVDPLAVSPP